MAKTEEQKQETTDARNKRRRENYAQKGALKPVTVDIRILEPGDKFILEGKGYVITSIDWVWDHVHTKELEGPYSWAIDFGTQVTKIA